MPISKQGASSHLCGGYVCVVCYLFGFVFRHGAHVPHYFATFGPRYQVLSSPVGCGPLLFRHIFVKVRFGMLTFIVIQNS